MDKDNNSFISNQLDNERTFLSWIRTAIGIMVFGFVLFKFSVVMNEMPDSFYQKTKEKNYEFSLFIGIAFVTSGAVMMLLAYGKYRQTQKELKAGKYSYSTLLLTVLTTIVFLMSMLVIIYLIITAYPMIFKQ